MNPYGSLVKDADGHKIEFFFQFLFNSCMYIYFLILTVHYQSSSCEKPFINKKVKYSKIKIKHVLIYI